MPSDGPAASQRAAGYLTARGAGCNQNAVGLAATVDSSSDLQRWRLHADGRGDLLALPVNIQVRGGCTREQRYQLCVPTASSARTQAASAPARGTPTAQNAARAALGKGCVAYLMPTPIALRSCDSGLPAWLAAQAGGQWVLKRVAGSTNQYTVSYKARSGRAAPAVAGWRLCWAGAGDRLRMRAWPAAGCCRPARPAHAPPAWPRCCLQSTVRQAYSYGSGQQGGSSYSSQGSRWWWDGHAWRQRGLLAAAATPAVSNTTAPTAAAAATTAATSTAAPAASTAAAAAANASPANPTAAGAAAAASTSSAAAASHGGSGSWWWRPRPVACTRYLGAPAACDQRWIGLYAPGAGAGLVWELTPVGGTGPGQILAVTLTAGNTINVFVRSAGAGAAREDRRGAAQGASAGAAQRASGGGRRRGGRSRNQDAAPAPLSMPARPQG